MLFVNDLIVECQGILRVRKGGEKKGPSDITSLLTQTALWLSYFEKVLHLD